MSRTLPTIIAIAAIAGLIPFPGAPLVSEAADAHQEPAALLPTPLDPDQFAGLLDHSPFTRDLDPSETIRLTGVAMINGEQVATVRDQKRGKNYVISGKPNQEGWKMVEVDHHIELEKVSATISVNGGEVVTLKFDEKQLHPEVKAKGVDAIQASEKNARRPPPTNEEKRKFGEQVRGRMSKMSDAQKKRVGQIMQEKMKANPKLSDHQKGEVFVKILDHVESGK